MQFVNWKYNLKKMKKKVEMQTRCFIMQSNIIQCFHINVTYNYYILCRYLYIFIKTVHKEICLTPLNKSSTELADPKGWFRIYWLKKGFLQLFINFKVCTWISLYTP